MTDAPPPPQQPSSAPPGWYPTSPGTQGYWDGAQWTTQAPLAPRSPNGDDKTWAILMHLSVWLAGFIGPLVIYLVKRDESPFLREHAAAALNAQLTLLIAAVAGVVLLLVIVGIFVLLGAMVAAFVFPIMGAVRASRMEPANFPMVIRFVR